MQKYINQLIGDLRQAEENPTPEVNLSADFEQRMHEIEEGLRYKSTDILKIKYEELPPAERMSEDQTKELLTAIINALAAKGTQVHFPGDGTAPIKLCYSELREEFVDGFHAMPGWNIDFCSGDCPSCAFVDYCKTKDDI